ncbi:MAG: penicillin-binding protein activator [Patescibacteria group bacterium]
MNKKIIWSTTGILIVLIIIFIVHQNKVVPQPQAPIKIGALLSLTGGASAWGENSQKGIALAVEEVNAKGGINGRQVEVLYEDTASDPKVSVSAFQKLISLDHVDAIIGPLNQTETAPVIPLIAENNIPTIAPGFLPLKDRQNIYNPIFVWTDAEIEAGRLAQYVYEKGIRTVGVIGTLDAWENTVTTAFADKFKALGGTVTALEKVQPDSSDMKLSVTKVVATKPQAIYLGTYYQFVNSLKEIHTQGYKGQLFGIEVDDYLATETSKWSNGLQFIAPNYYTTTFIDNFRAKYSAEPGMPAGQSYDAAKILFSILEQGDRSKVLEAMKNFKEYTGVSGKLTISPEGRTSLPTAIFEIKDGKISRAVSLE